MKRRFINFGIEIAIPLLLFFGSFSVTVCEDESIMVEALGKVVSVLESGVIDFADVFAKDPLQKAGLAVFKIVPNVIKGLVPGTDPAVAQTAAMEKTFKKIVGAFANSITAQIEDVRTFQEWTQPFKKLESRANSSASIIAGVFQYNISAPLLQTYMATCQGVYGPVPIKNDFYFEIIQKCQGKFTESQMKRFAAMLKFLEKFEVEISLKMKLALQSTLSQRIHRENIDWMLEVKDRGPYMVNEMVTKLVADYDKDLCPYHYVFYGSGCSRTSLIRAYAETLNAFFQISSSALACGLITQPNEMAFIDYIDDFYSSILTMIQVLPKFLEEKMQTTHLVCDRMTVSTAVTQFPGPRIIQDYSAFGEYVATRLRQLNPETKHNLVISGYKGKDTKYWCLTSMCDIYWHESRSVMVVYESHKHSDDEIEPTTDFLDNNMQKINQTINDNFWKSLDDLKKIMNSYNISLSAHDRFTKEIWIRHQQFSAPCTFDFYLTSDSNTGTMVNLHLSFHNVYYIKTDYCNTFEIFLFP